MIYLEIEKEGKQKFSVEILIINIGNSIWSWCIILNIKDLMDSPVSANIDDSATTSFDNGKITDIY